MSAATPGRRLKGGESIAALLVRPADAVSDAVEGTLPLFSGAVLWYGGPPRTAVGSARLERTTMSLLVTGSIGIDTVETPTGKVADVLGGSSVYFSYAASFFAPVRFVGVIGEDAPADFLQPLRDNARVDMAGLEVRKGSRTFRWHGRYHVDVNERDTVNVELNVLGEKGPTIPQSFRDSRFVFLANTHPALQIELVGQLDDPALVVADTMDLWITNERETLLRLMGMLDGLVLNDSEAKLLTGKSNVVAAGLEIAEQVKRFVIVKKGEHGSLLFADRRVSALPSYPTVNVVDPTGAGDSFAGAMMGYLASVDRIDAQALRRGVACGTVTASFCLEDFSLRRFQGTSREEIDRRLDEFQDLLRF
ncbi:MAG: aminoimidazole riboside kinase [Planctomycetes bacterium ADurb.Bin126]|nr:MAG: aminoimidazole riboside kinase [Planctomycetes bacterium ADurb.Bin126]